MADEEVPWYLVPPEEDGASHELQVAASLAHAIKSDTVDTYPLELPDFSCWPDRMDYGAVAFVEAIVAATTTPHFPVLKAQHLADVNRGIQEWRSPT